MKHTLKATAAVIGIIAAIERALTSAKGVSVNIMELAPDIARLTISQTATDRRNDTPRK